MPWIAAGALDDVDHDDLVSISHNGRDDAIYRTEHDEYFCTDDRCTPEDALLSGGLLTGHVIECPRHNGGFDIRNGAALRAQRSAWPCALIQPVWETDAPVSA